jgi:hypothetical protein
MTQNSAILHQALSDKCIAFQSELKMKHSVFIELVRSFVEPAIAQTGFSYESGNLDPANFPRVWFSNNDHVLSLAYDTRDNDLGTSLYSKSRPSKTYLYVIGELRRLGCDLPGKWSNAEEVSLFLAKLAEALQVWLPKLLVDFEEGNYFGGHQ